MPEDEEDKIEVAENPFSKLIKEKGVRHVIGVHNEAYSEISDHQKADSMAAIMDRYKDVVGKYFLDELKVGKHSSNENRPRHYTLDTEADDFLEHIEKIVNNVVLDHIGKYMGKEAAKVFAKDPEFLKGYMRQHEVSFDNIVKEVKIKYKGRVNDALEDKNSSLQKLVYSMQNSENDISRKRRQLDDAFSSLEGDDEDVLKKYVESNLQGKLKDYDNVKADQLVKTGILKSLSKGKPKGAERVMYADFLEGGDAIKKKYSSAIAGQDQDKYKSLMEELDGAPEYPVDQKYGT